MFQSALKVFESEADKVGSRLEKIPDLSSYDWGCFPPQSLGMFGKVYHRNASVALQLCRRYYEHFHQLLPESHSTNNSTNVAAASGETIPTAAGKAHA